MFNVAAAIVIACGVADNEKTLTCWDVLNNCTVAAAFKYGNGEATEKDFNKCKANFTQEAKRLEKLEEK